MLIKSRNNLVGESPLAADLGVVSEDDDIEIKNLEVNYRGIFQKTLARKICKTIVYDAKHEGKTGFSYGRYSDAPERNGIPCKYFAVVANTTEEDLEAEAGGKVE